jgi:hypothetical protein
VPAIALSIGYAGADNLLDRGGRVGVEIGQLMVVASALTALRTRSELSGRRIAFAGSLGRHRGGRVLVHPARLFSGPKGTPIHLVF